MGSRNNGKNKEKNIKCDSNKLSKEQIIEIQAEAYYRALKKIEDEKSKVNEQKGAKKYKWYEEILFILNVWLFPFKINKKYHLNKGIYDSILVLLVSIVLYFCGFIMWVTGIIMMIINIYRMYMQINTEGLVDGFLWIFTGMFVGSILILAGKEFSNETDSNKIYAYSASIIALISCVIGIIALLQKL